jgi:hypothetical protein
MPPDPLLDAARRALETLREYYDDYLDRVTIKHSDGSVLAGPDEDDAEHLQTIKEVIDELDAAINQRTPQP